MTPLVLHHGLFGYTHLRLGPLHLSYFKNLDQTLAHSNRPVLLTHVHPTASIERRAAQLKRSLLGQLHERNLAHEKVVILAHSLGGLDARYMISHLGMHDRVAALVTISTPHAGSPYADFCLHNLSRTGILRAFDFLGLDLSAIKDLTRDAAAGFSDDTPDSPDVRYYSVSACRPWTRITPPLILSHRIIHKAEGDNDGLVSTHSASHGEHLATWPADHWHVINRGFNLELHRHDIRPRYASLLKRLHQDQVLDPALPG